MATRPRVGSSRPDRLVLTRPAEELAPAGGRLPAGTYRVIGRRLILPASPIAWASRAPRLPGSIATAPDPCVGGAVLEVEPSPYPPGQTWWYHVEVIGLDLPAASVAAPAFFAPPPHQPGQAFPAPDLLPPLIAVVRLPAATFARWIELLRATPYPHLWLDPAADLAQLELSDIG
jgi:hypothetical protein